MPRDRVLLLLWPDSDPARARSSLNQLLYTLRRDLGVTDLVLGTATLRLDRLLVASDVADLEAALAAGRPGDAIVPYAGPFLEGFSVPGLPDFDRWAEAERTRLATRHREAVEAVATATPSEAGVPLVERPLHTPPGAIHPDGSGRNRPPRRSLLPAVGLAGLAVAAAVIWIVSRPGSATPEPAEIPVTVFPFVIHGGDSDGLGAAVPSLLAASLDGAGAYRAVDSSLSITARLVVRGEVVRTRDRVRLVARFGPPDSIARVAAASAEGPADSLFSLVDQLAAGLLASRAGTPRERLARVAATTTASLPALKAYMEGEREMRADRYAEAANAFRRAVELDTAFALAYYRLTRAAEWAGRDTLSRWAAGRAARFAGRLADDDRMLLEAADAWRAGDVAAAETRLRSVVDAHPDNVDAWFDLGEVVFHGNPLRGRSATEAAEAFRRVLALDPADAEALVHLARIEWLRGQPRVADSLVRQALVRVGEEAMELRAFRAFALGDRDAHKETTRALLASRGRVTAPSALAVAVYLDDLEGTEQFGRALAREGQPVRLRSLGSRILARTDLARGRWRDGFAHLRASRSADPVSALELRGLAAALPFIAYPPDTLRAVAAELEAWDPERETAHSLAHLSMHPQIRLHLLGLVRAALGDSAGANAAAGELARMGDGGAMARIFAASVRAHVAARSGHHAEALKLIEGAGWAAVAGAFEAEALDRYLRAEALARTGRAEEAVGWFSSLGERAAYELIYAAPAAAWQARLFEAAGRADEAGRHGRRARELWSRADPEAVPPAGAAAAR